jgi:hypothetical protein
VRRERRSSAKAVVMSGIALIVFGGMAIALTATGAVDDLRLRFLLVLVLGIPAGLAMLVVGVVRIRRERRR